MTWLYLVMFGLMVVAIYRMWRDRHGVVVRQRDPAFDPTEGHPQAGEALDHLANARWTQLTALYWKLPGSDRYHLLQGLGEVAGRHEIAWPEDADSGLMTIRASVQVGRAWSAMKAGISGKAGRQTFMGAMQGLAEARKLLADAAIRNPHDTANFAMQIRAETLTDGDPAVVNNLLGKVDAADEINIFAAMNHLQFASPLWRGSVDRMWRVANDYASHPRNAAWLAIAARAHIEEWRHAMSIDRSLTPGYIARLQDDGFVEHIRKLDREFWRALDREPMSRAEAHVAHNTFAFLLRMVRVNDLAAAHLERMGPHIAAQPWSYLPDGAERPTRLLMQMRREAGLKAFATA